MCSAGIVQREVLWLGRGVALLGSRAPCRTLRCVPLISDRGCLRMKQILFFFPCMWTIFSRRVQSR